MRTTVDIADPILREIKAIQEKEGRSMGAVVSELLADALSRRRRNARARPAFRWTSRAMKALVDLSDKDAVYAAFDRDWSERSESSHDIARDGAERVEGSKRRP